MSKNKFIYVFLACLMAVLMVSCEEIKLLQEKKITSLSLESNLSKTSFLYSEQAKGIAEFTATVYDQNQKEINGEKIVFTHNLPNSARITEANNILSVDLDSIKALGEFYIEAKSEKNPEISQTYTFSIDSNVVLNPKYSFISAARISSDGEAIELDENGDQIQTDNDRLSIMNNSISMIATGLNGICLNVSEEDFGRIKWNIEENEKFNTLEKENKLFVIPDEYLKFGENDKSFNIKAVAGKKEKEITITVNNNVDEGLTAPVINDLVYDEITGGYVSIFGDSVGNKNILNNEIKRLSFEDIENPLDIEHEVISYGVKYIIKNCGKYTINSSLVSSTGSQSASSTKSFVIDPVASSSFTPLVVSENLQSEKEYITSYNYSQFAKENLVSVSVTNSSYNMKLRTIFESSESSEKNMDITETITKGSNYSKSYQNSGNYTFIYWAENNKTFGNVPASELSVYNSITKTAVILDARDINSMSWFSETVTSAEGNTSITSKITIDDVVFAIDNNLKMKFTVFKYNTFNGDYIQKKTATLDKSTKSFEYTISDSKPYYVVCFVYMPKTKYFSQIKKVKIFQTSPPLTAYPSSRSYDSEQDTYDQRKVIITNTKNFSGQGRNLYYAWSSSKAIPTSWNTLCSNGSTTSEYSLYFSDNSKPYLHLKNTPYNENLSGETTTCDYYTISYYGIDNCNLRVYQHDRFLHWGHGADVYLYKNNTNIKGLQADCRWYWSDKSFHKTISETDKWVNIGDLGTGAYYGGVAAAAKFQAYGYKSQDIYHYHDYPATAFGGYHFSYYR